MSKLFSKRNTPPPAEFRYDIPEQVRSRILAVFKDHASQQHGFEGLLDDIGNVLYKHYGGLRQSAYEAARRSNNPVIEHFFCCNDEHALDFIEVSFQQWPYQGGQEGVDEINEIFREHGIGYELTPYVEHHVEKEEISHGRKEKRTFIETDYPQIISETFCVRYIVSKSFRKEALRKLVKLNISSATLFPGIDGFGRSLKFQVLENIRKIQGLSNI